MRTALFALAMAVVLPAIALLAGTPLSAAGAPPVAGWEPPGDPAMRSGGNMTFQAILASPACSTLSFQWFVDGALVPGEAKSAFGFRAGTELSGIVRVAVSVFDGNATARHSWNLTVEATLRPLPDGPVTIAEGGIQAFRVLGAGGRNLTWFLDGADTGQNGTDYYFAPDFRSAGTHTVSVSLEDATVRSWTVTVTDVNRPPVLPPGRLLRVVAGETIRVRACATDPDGGPLLYRWDLDSDGTAERESNSSGNLSVRFDRAGVYRATLNVTDGGGASAISVYLFDVRERPAISAWALPAALAGLAALALAVVAAVQVRRLSRLREARSRAGFFAKREHPPPAAPAGRPPEGSTADASSEKDDEPELLQVRSLLPAKRAELEASADHIQPDIPLSKRFTPTGPPGVPSAEEREKAGAPAGALRDKGAESETGAQDSDVGRPGFAPRKK
jgi:hypothetical protein